MKDKLLATLAGLITNIANNKTLWTSIAVFVGSILVNRYPILVTVWCPKELTQSIFDNAYLVTKAGVMVIGGFMLRHIFVNQAKLNSLLADQNNKTNEPPKV